MERRKEELLASIWKDEKRSCFKKQQQSHQPWRIKKVVLSRYEFVVKISRCDVTRAKTWHKNVNKLNNTRKILSNLRASYESYHLPPKL